MKYLHTMVRVTDIDESLAFFSALGLKPLPVILFAQAANGILLPVIALYLLSVMNDGKLLGDYRNPPMMNLIGGLVAGITLLLGLRSIASVMGLF